MLKARTVELAETRQHLRDAHDRVMSVATVQQQLQASAHGGAIELGPYLARLCDALAASMIGDSRPIILKVEADPGTGVSAEAVSIGLITTELVINALKHGFPNGGNGGGEILVKYEVDEANWRLLVSDNGVGLQQDGGRRGHAGLGTTIVEAPRPSAQGQRRNIQPIARHGRFDRPHCVMVTKVRVANSRGR